MAPVTRLAAVLLLLLAPAAQAVDAHKDDGRCLGTLDAEIGVLEFPQNAEEWAVELAHFQEVRAAWQQALKEDASIDPATLQSITDAARAERAHWVDRMAKANDEEFSALQVEVYMEADACLSYAPAAAH